MVPVVTGTTGTHNSTMEDNNDMMIPAAAAMLGYLKVSNMLFNKIILINDHHRTSNSIKVGVVYNTSLIVHWVW